MDFNLVKVVLLVLFACSVDGQSCQDSCRTVCDPLLPSTEGTNVAVQRGKKGPKGDFGPKGEKGNPGKDNSEVVGKNEREIEFLKFENNQQRERLDEISGRLEVEETKNKELLSLVKNISMCIPPTIANVTFAGDRFSHGDVIRARVDCDVMHFGEGAVERRCVSGNIVPDFYSVPLTCKKKYHLIKESMSWDSARFYCKTFYKDLIYDGIETTEKRKKICDFLKSQNHLFVGIRLIGFKPYNMSHGSLGDDFNFQWAPGYPNRRDDHRLAVLSCSSDNKHRGKFRNAYITYKNRFICQNY